MDIPKQTDSDPVNIPPSSEGRGIDSLDPVEARQARADMFLAAAALRSPAWAEGLRELYADDPQTLVELGEAFNKNALAGFEPLDKVSK